GPALSPEDREALDRRDADALFHLLEHEVVPLFYDRTADGLPAAWLERVRSAIRQLVPFFNTHRMVAEYVDTAYLTEPTGERMAGPGRKTAGETGRATTRTPAEESVMRMRHVLGALACMAVLMPACADAEPDRATPGELPAPAATGTLVARTGMFVDDAPPA